MLLRLSVPCPVTHKNIRHQKCWICTIKPVQVYQLHYRSPSLILTSVIRINWWFVQFWTFYCPLFFQWICYDNLLFISPPPPPHSVRYSIFALNSCQKTACFIKSREKARKKRDKSAEEFMADTLCGLQPALETISILKCEMKCEMFNCSRIYLNICLNKKVIRSEVVK